MIEHHPVFSKFKIWDGRPAVGFVANFLGVVTRSGFFSGLGEHPDSDDSKERPRLPTFKEAYFEWVDVLEAVTTATEHFTMIELGAGWGRWLVNAWAAARAYHGGLPCKLIGVEAEPTHCEWAELHFRDNHVDPGCYQLLHRAVAARDGVVWFHVGRPAEWYGQAIAPEPGQLERLVNLFKRRSRLKKVPAVSLATLLGPLTKVDLIDLDIQGAELAVLAACHELLHSRVKRIHIGTHSKEIEAGLRRLFGPRGWENVHDFPGGSEVETPYGRIRFQDGVQSWLNMRLV